ncbi:mediator of RNA polymerase II transcription subunit 22-like isoform X1 [Halichondria panicea]|uniref:mediator of RNA polymerase II transcription subunit 22-like isoform X1 n=1 Tax=Halichondria panicea TaxID=6063 RepID=UPI00312BC52F
MVNMSAMKKESLQVSAYSRRLKDNMKSILDNYAEILKAAKVTDANDPDAVSDAGLAHIENEIEVRAANIVRAAEGLSKLVSDLKENMILNDFSTINQSTTNRISELKELKSQKEDEITQLYSQPRELRTSL